MTNATPCRFIFQALRREDAECASTCCMCVQLAEVEFTDSLGMPVRMQSGAGSAAFGHPASFASDGIRSTKWLALNGPPWVLRLVLHVPLGAPLDSFSYTMLTANDEPSRDPIGWSLECRRRDGVFALVDAQHDVMPPAARMAPYQTFTIDAPSDTQPSASTARSLDSPPPPLASATTLFPPPSPSPPPPRYEQAVHAAVDALVAEGGPTNVALTLLVFGCGFGSLVVFAALYCLLRRAMTTELHRLRREVARLRSYPSPRNDGARRSAAGPRIRSGHRAEEALLVAEDGIAVDVMPAATKAQQAFLKTVACGGGSRGRGRQGAAPTHDIGHDRYSGA